MISPSSNPPESASAQKVLVVGDFPHCKSGSVLAKMLKYAGIELTNDPEEDYFLAIKWAPWSLFEITPELRARIKTCPIINDTHFNCRKSIVAAHFEKVFGYGLDIDPLTYQGVCVMKSEKNASHDGTLVQCPADERKPDVVYQRLVDNVVYGDYVVDIRVPVLGPRMPFAYLKYRTVACRFANQNAYARITPIETQFSAERLCLLKQFAESIGLQYGEIDVLRDATDGRIYVVDVNNTPYGPPNHIEPADHDQAVRILAGEFLQQFAPEGVRSCIWESERRL